MEKEKEAVEDNETKEESSDFILCEVSECDVYLLPSDTTTFYSFALLWNLDKPDWKGSLKITSKAFDCVIRLQNKLTGELFAQVVYTSENVFPSNDSDRHFILRVKEPCKTCSIVSSIRHIGVGFRRSAEAFDFEAAPLDNLRYLQKMKAAEELKQAQPVDYRLKEGESLVIQLSKIVDHALSLDDTSLETGMIYLPLPPPPPPPPPDIRLPPPPPPDIPDDNFGDFQWCRKRKWDYLADYDSGDFQCCQKRKRD